MAFSISIGSDGFFDEQLHINAVQEIVDMQFVFETPANLIPQKRVIAANGANSASLDTTIPANAIVDEYQVRVKAARASFSKASLAGELRQSSSSPLEVVIDFGKMLTVNAIRIPYIVTDYHAYSWLGSKFDLANDVRTSFSSPPIDAGLPSEIQETYVFSQEIRTERLLLVFPDSIGFDTVKDNLELSLPDLPSDLAITINGGAPIWQYQGMVQPGSSAEISDEEWNTEGELFVSLAAPLQALAGDASRNVSLPLNIELSSKTPGDIGIEFHSRSLRLLHRLTFDGQQEFKANFAMEGKIPLGLISPGINGSTPRLLGIQLTLAAEFPLERAIPAVGALANNTSQLVLGNGKAACVRLDNIDKLAQISGIRIPLSTSSSRAETRVVLWKGDQFAPSKAIEEGVSDPQSWGDKGASKKSGDGEQWLVFNFAEPIEHTDTDTFWVAVIVERGEVSWKLANSSSGEEYPVRLGAPAGPWRALPTIFSVNTNLGPVSGRLHVLGIAAEISPLAPLQLSLDTNNDSIDVTPSEAGENVQLTIGNPGESANPGGTPLNKAELSIISRAVGPLTLSKVNVITEEITV